MSLFSDQGLVRASSKPAAAADGAVAQPRSDEYGALHTRRELLAWAQEGSYFKAVNAAPGTGIAMGIQTAFSDTANILALLRSNGTKNIIPHYMRLLCTAAGASSIAAQLAVKVDTGDRYTSGGTDLTPQIVCANSGLAPVSGVDILRFGAITGKAVVAPRLVANMMLKTQAAPCWVVGDEVFINFLAGEGLAATGNLAGAAAQQFVKDVGPVMLSGANHTLLFHLFQPSNATTPPSWEVELAWWER